MERIEITGIGSELQGVGRLRDGRAAFVPGAIPGETVDIEIIRDKGRFCEASLVEIVQPSPDRIQPDCPHAGRCGGCQGRHIRYERTLQLKRQTVYDALCRIGAQEAPTVFDTLGCVDPNRTRNKAEYPIGEQDERMVIGAFERGGRRVVPLQDCLLQAPESVRVLKHVSEHLNRWGFARHLKFLVTRVNRQGELMAVLCGDAPLAAEIRKLSPTLPGVKSLWYCQLNRRYTHALDGRCTLIAGDPTLRERINDLEFEISPQSFFQVNIHQTERLYQIALEAAGARPGCGLRLLDAYCGAGTITLSAAKLVESALGIEIVPPAIENARRNAEINRIDNARFICGDAAREIPRLLAKGERFDAVILDPPRKGADNALLDALIDAKIPVISYVSCNPATLARDVKRLCEHSYQLHWAQPVDMFPWTGHVETIATLSQQISTAYISVPYTPPNTDYMKLKPGTATYREIQKWVEDNYGFKVSNLYVAQLKQKYGIKDRDNYNLPKSDKYRKLICPPEKEEAIIAAFKHFNMI